MSFGCQFHVADVLQRLFVCFRFIDKAQQSVQTFGDVEVAKTIKAALDETEKKKYDHGSC